MERTICTYYYENWLKYVKSTLCYVWHEISIYISLRVYVIHVSDSNDSCLLRTYYVPGALQELSVFLTYFILVTILWSSNNFIYFLISHVRNLKLRKLCNSPKITEVNGKARIQTRQSGFGTSALNMFSCLERNHSKKLNLVSQVNSRMQSVLWGEIWS